MQDGRRPTADSDWGRPAVLAGAAVSLLLGAGGILGRLSLAAGEERQPAADAWQQAAVRAKWNQEALQRVDRVLRAWLKKIDPQLGLVPQEYQGPQRWTVANAAADLYSSLVMCAAFVDRSALDGVLRQAIATERRYAQRIGCLPDDLDLRSLKFLHPEPSAARSIFGASEWCRDGLLRITEILGPGTPWSERLAELATEIMLKAEVPTSRGPIPRGDHEIDGEMLQTLSRLYWLTGEAKYLAWARRIGEYHLFDRPPHKGHSLRLRDHGGEIISGLAELFVAVSAADPAQAVRYREPLRAMLDRVLEIGQAPDGMLYNLIDPLEGKVLAKGLRPGSEGINTNWGYTCNAHCSYDMATGEQRYTQRVLKALAALPAGYMDDAPYQDPVWRGSSDYFADFIENAIVLHNRFRVEGVEAWAERTIRRMWAFQQPDGTVNRHYHDGSFGRTTILFARLLSEGTRVEPWREDLCWGAVASGDAVRVVLRAQRPWSGRLIFDRERFREVLRLPLNYPRINELPEWYTVASAAAYEVSVDGKASRSMRGAELAAGLALRLEPGRETGVLVRKAPAEPKEEKPR